MSYIGKKPTDKVLTASDITDGIISTAKIADTAITNAKLNADIISGDTALGAEPADTDELLISDAGVLKRMDYSHIKGGGKVLQIVQATDTTTRSTTATSFTDLGWTASITPSATSSKILVHATCFLACNADHVVMRLMRDTTAIGTGVAVSSRPGISGMFVGSGHSGINQTTIYLDSPSSTSALTYKIQWYKNSTIAYNNRTPGDLDYIVGGRGISMLQLMEIGA